jgi:hypothetical protein
MWKIQTLLRGGRFGEGLEKVIDIVKQEMEKSELSQIADGSLIGKIYIL